MATEKLENLMMSHQHSREAQPTEDSHSYKNGEEKMSHISFSLKMFQPDNIFTSVAAIQYCVCACRSDKTVSRYNP